MKTGGMETPGPLTTLTTSALPPALAGQAIVMPALRPPEDAAEIDLRACWRTLRGNVWLVLGTALLFTLVALGYVLTAAPVYEANMLIHVEEDLPNPARNELSVAAELFETKKAAIAEMELLRSRVVIGRAVDALRLDVEVLPRHFPVGGAWYASVHGDALAPAPFGLSRYAWGGEVLDVASLELPPAWYRRDFVLTAGTAGHYHLSGAGLELDGVTGAMLTAAQGRFRLRVGRLLARPGTRFTVRRLPRLAVVERLQNDIVLAEEGKQSGVIEVKYHGPNAATAAALLTEVARQYLGLNLARKTEEAEKSLAFLDVQLPALRRQLEQAEARYNEFRLSHGTVNVAEEGRIQLQNAALAHARLIELQQRRIELLTHYTGEHPLVQGVDAQLRHTGQEIAALGASLRTLPLIEQEEARLTRDVKIAADGYTALSNTAQQLRLASVARVSNVRLVDAPVVPERPAKPDRPLVLALALTSGLFCGALLALGRRALRGGLDDGDQVEQLLGARVVAASIPHSRGQGRLRRRGRRGGGRLPLLAHAAPEDAAIDSLRAFRGALQCALPHLRNGMVVLNGPERGVGTSFLAANLAVLVAAGGKRVLLIDANLRHGRLHRYFDQQPDMGLAEILAGTLEARLAIRRHVLDRLDFIACGAAGANRSEYLQQFNFDALVDVVIGAYDLVLIDAPPLLAQADALVVSARAGALFLVARAGVTTARQIAEALKRSSHAGIAPSGIVFNAVMA